MSDHLNKRITKLEVRVGHLEDQNTPRQEDVVGEGLQGARTEQANSTHGQAPLVQKIPSTPPTSNQPQKSWYKTLSGWKTVLEIVAIPFAVGYAVVTYYQWRDAQNSFRISERAWLFPEANNFYISTDGNNPAALAIFKNTGHTPAFDVTALVCSEVRSTEPTTVPPAKNSSCRTLSEGTIGPNVTFTLGFADTTVKMDARVRAQFSSTTIKIYYWGKISYRSLAGVNSPYTQFCLMSMTMPQNGGTVPATQLAPCANGNDAR
jgi:hypothetical protein